MRVKMQVRQAVERISGLAVYRSPPRGFNLYADLAAIPIPPPRMVFDIGAHHGKATAEYLDVWKSAVIHSVEPFSESFEILQTRFAKNPLISCHQIALGDSERDGPLLIRSGSVNNSLKDYEESFAGEALLGAEQVTIRTLTSLCQDLGIQHIDFLKVDTEGADLEVLMGAEQMLARRAIGVIQVEVGVDPDNHKHVPLEACKPKVEEFGYRLFGIYEQVRDFPHGRWHLRRCNAVFISNELSSS